MKTKKATLPETETTTNVDVIEETLASNVTYTHEHSLPWATKVNSLEGVKMGVLYETMNYDLFIEREDNRSGNVSAHRVKAIEDEINLEKFKFVVCFVLIDSTGLIFNGTHTVVALKNTGNPIPFMIVPFLTTDEVARYNSAVNPVWSQTDGFKSATIAHYPIAEEFQKYIQKCVELEINPKSIVPSNMFSILKRDIKLFEKKIIREYYNDPVLTKRLSSDEYKRDMELYCSLKKKYDVVQRNCVFIRAIFELIFKTDNFNYEAFIRQLNTVNMNGFGYTKRKEFRDLVADIYERGLKKVK